MRRPRRRQFRRRPASEPRGEGAAATSPPRRAFGCLSNPQPSDSAQHIVPGTAERPSHSAHNFDGRIHLPRLNLLQITPADVGLFRQTLLRHPQIRAQAAHIPAELLMRLRRHALHLWNPKRIGGVLYFAFLIAMYSRSPHIHDHTLPMIPFGHLQIRLALLLASVSIRARFSPTLHRHILAFGRDSLPS